MDSNDLTLHCDVAGMMVRKGNGPNIALFPVSKNVQPSMYIYIYSDIATCIYGYKFPNNEYCINLYIYIHINQLEIGLSIIDGNDKSIDEFFHYIDENSSFCDSKKGITIINGLFFCI